MSLINDFLSLIYPRHCESCDNSLFKHESYLCNYCRVSLPKSDYHKHTDHALSKVLAGRIPYMDAMSLYVFEKSGRVQKLLHSIKYQGQKDLATHLGKLYAYDLLSEGFNSDFDVIVPVPLHPSKLRQRGFNQSEHFARGLAEGLNKNLETEKMIRSVATSTQTRKKKFERWENVEGIFELKDKAFFVNRHVLLVDDVITTGATLEAAWQCLKDVEGIKVSIASIAFANN